MVPQQFPRTFATTVGVFVTVAAIFLVIGRPGEVVPLDVPAVRRGMVSRTSKPHEPTAIPQSSFKSKNVSMASTAKSSSVGTLPGTWVRIGNMAAWEPADEAARGVYVHYHASPAARAAAGALLAGRHLYFLGDSVVRDLAVRAVDLLAPETGAGTDADAAQMTRAAAKARCVKPNPYDRDAAGSCNFTLRSTSPATTGSFSWLQWLALPHRMAAGNAIGGRTSPWQRFQEVDACCPTAHGPNGTVRSANVTGAPSMRDCLDALLAGARPVDVLVIRSGLNYVLYDHAINYETEYFMPHTWLPAYHAELRAFLALLPTLFPGTVLWWHLTPLLPGGDNRLPACKPSEQFRIFRATGSIVAVNNATATELAAARGVDPAFAARLVEVGPPNFVLPPQPRLSDAKVNGALAADMTDFYVDCLHHTAELFYATYSLMLNAMLPALTQASA